jgi:phosphoenolpyruvate carboxylase
LTDVSFVVLYIHIFQPQFFWIKTSFSLNQIQAAFRTDEIRRTPPTPQDEMRAGMSYFHETICKGVPKFLRRVDTALKNIGINERVPYNAPLIQFSSWMGGDRDGISLHNQRTLSLSLSLSVCGNMGA